ncbi:chitin binding peritrophin-A domain-containing protein [Streptomyces sp. NPDC051567]|uniref:chitin binding peritrophin-A domain-containing protein n=1 Tax=Streptomyces sp. NPDC051567 TaxID=3365660 RepID=UPI0037A4794A
MLLRLFPKLAAVSAVTFLVGGAVVPLAHASPAVPVVRAAPVGECVSLGQVLLDDTDPQIFYVCGSDGVLTQFICPLDLVFDESIEACGPRLP